MYFDICLFTYFTTRSSHQGFTSVAGVNNYCSAQFPRVRGEASVVEFLAGGHQIIDDSCEFVGGSGDRLWRSAVAVIDRLDGMSNAMRITSDHVRELLQADGVKPQSVSPYVAAWNWAESGKTETALSDATVRTDKADARRVYRLTSAKRPR